MKEDGLLEGFNFAGPSEFLVHLIFRGFRFLLMIIFMRQS